MSNYNPGYNQGYNQGYSQKPNQNPDQYPDQYPFQGPNQALNPNQSQYPIQNSHVDTSWDQLPPSYHDSPSGGSYGQYGGSKYDDDSRPSPRDSRNVPNAPVHPNSSSPPRYQNTSRPPSGDYKANYDNYGSSPNNPNQYQNDSRPPSGDYNANYDDYGSSPNDRYQSDAYQDNPYESNRPLYRSSQRQPRRSGFSSSYSGGQRRSNGRERMSGRKMPWYGWVLW